MAPMLLGMIAMIVYNLADIRRGYMVSVQNQDQLAGCLRQRGVDVSRLGVIIAFACEIGGARPLAELL